MNSKTNWGENVELLCDRQGGRKGEAGNTGQEVQGTSQPSLQLYTFQLVPLDPCRPRSTFPAVRCGSISRFVILQTG